MWIPNCLLCSSCTDQVVITLWSGVKLLLWEFSPNIIE
jgi:hypothetical protein